MENKPEYKELENPYMADMIENSLYMGNNVNNAIETGSYCCYNFTHCNKYLYSSYVASLRDKPLAHIYILVSILLPIMLSIPIYLFFDYFMCKNDDEVVCIFASLFLSLIVSLSISQCIIIVGSFSIVALYLTVLKLIECHRKHIF